MAKSRPRFVMGATASSVTSPGFSRMTFCIKGMAVFGAKPVSCS